MAISERAIIQRSKREPHGQREDEISIGDRTHAEKTGYVVSSWLLILVMIPSKIQAGMAPTSWNGSWEESKRGLLEESIVESIVEID
jgi:hypothetical protein